MSYLNVPIPTYPYFIISGNATYRPGDVHSNRNGIDCFDVIVVTQGTLYMHVHHESYAIHAGSVLIIPPNTSHYGYKICNETTFFHWLHFNTAESFNISDLPKSLGEPHVASIDEAAENIVSFPLFQSLSNESFAKICSLLQQLESMSINRFEKSTRILKPIGSPLHQQSLLMQILQILSMFPDNTVKNNSCYMILQYLSLHYSEKIELSKLAEIASCHPTQVIRNIKKQYGMSPFQLLNNIRLQRSCEFLKRTDMTVAEIAYAVGFASSSYFCKQFKLVYKTSPKQYRLHHTQ